MRTDGSVVFGVNMDTSPADKKLAKLKEKIEDATESLDAKNERKSSIQKEFEDAKNEALKTETVIKRLQNQISELRKTGDMAGIKNPVGLSEAESQLREQEALLRQQDREAERLGKQYEKITDEVNKSTDSLKKMQEEAGAVQRQIDAEAASSSRMSEAMEQAQEKMERFKSRIGSLVKSALVFNVISKGLQEMASYMGTVIKTNDKAVAALGELKGALLTLIQPVVDIVIPAFTQLVNILAKVVSYAAAVVSALFGKTSDESSEAAEELYNEAEAVEGVGDAAKEASKALAGFDEINRLSTGTADGASKTDGASETDGIIPNFKAAASAELPLSLRLSIEDVFFNEGEVNAETIAEKAIAYLSGIIGGLAGIAVAGVPGAIVGSLLGLVLGVAIDSLIFNHDGEFSEKEIQASIRAALISALGAVAGFTIGHWAGAALGATIGLALTAAIENFSLKKEEKIRKDLNEEFDGLLDDITETTEFAAALRVRITNITGDIDPEDQAKLDIAQQLVDEIFDLDAKDNKTAQELDLLKQKIEQLNGMQLDGIQITFDETTGHVVQTKQEVTNLLEEIKKQYELEAYREAIIEARKAQIEAERKLKEALGEVEKAQEAIAQQEEKYQEAKEAYNNHETKFMDVLLGKIDKEEIALGMARDKEKAALEELQGELAKAEANVDSFRDSYNEAGEKLSYFEGKLQDLSTTIDDWESTVGEKMKEAGSNIVKSLKEGMEKKESELSQTVSRISGIISGISGKTSSFFSGVLSKKSATYAAQPNLAALASLPIPRLAQGTVIPPNREFLAVLGDQSSGNNIEAPEGLLRQIAREESGANEIVPLLRAMLIAIKEGKVFMVDRTVFGRLVHDANGQETHRIGMRFSES